ncbi:Uncharacterised protein [Mycobacteroides abscessus subsp. abscessus]|nr:Uncharacterised protein [Mycobacteroides abscessus subsp. abscessus]
MPFQARFTTCAATTSLAGSRASNQAWPTMATRPTSACAYRPAKVGS